MIEAALRSRLPHAPHSIESDFNEAVSYAIFPGGKRLRPILTLLGGELFGGSAKDLVVAACAVEFIHTSSIIFDDLPSMDDSAERRGLPSLHTKFGDGLATLVAIGFLNTSYALVSEDARKSRRRASDAVLEIVDCVGPAGMIGGQSLDLRLREIAECKICSARISGGALNLKTSSLIRLALRIGAILSGAEAEKLEVLSQFAERLGQAYQISDDIIDRGDDVTASGVSFLTDVSPIPFDALSVAIDDAKSILVNNFPSSNARTCLTQFVEYVSLRTI